MRKILFVAVLLASVAVSAQGIQDQSTGPVVAGNQTFSGTKTFSSVIDAPGMTNTTGAATLTLKGAAPTTGTAVGVILDNAINLTTAGDTICSFRNAGVEKVSISKDGNIVTSGSFSGGGLNFNFGGLTGQAAGTSVSIVSVVSDGASAVGTYIQSPTYTTPGSKILSIRNFATEVVAFDRSGKSIYPTGGAADVSGISSAMTAGVVTISTTAVTANSIILYSVRTAGGTQGFLRVSAVVAGTSFTISSTSGTETSTLSWKIEN